MDKEQTLLVVKQLQSNSERILDRENAELEKLVGVQIRDIDLQMVANIKHHTPLAGANRSTNLHQQKRKHNSVLNGICGFFPLLAHILQYIVKYTFYLIQIVLVLV